MVQFRAGAEFVSRESVTRGTRLIERLPSEHWDSRRDPEWVVDLLLVGHKVDTKVFAESKITSEYVTDEQ